MTKKKIATNVRISRMSAKQLKEPIRFIPLLLLDRYAIEPISAPSLRDQLLSQARAIHVPDLKRLTRGRSFNAEQIISLGLLYFGDTAIKRLKARNFLISYYDYQLGYSNPPEDLALLRFYGGSEQNSTTYESYRAMVDAGAYIWATDHNDDILKLLTIQSMLVRGAIGSLMSSTAIAANLQRAKNGQIFQTTRFYSPVGERGVAHDLSTMAMIAEELRNQPYICLRMKDPEVPIFEAACKRMPANLRMKVLDPIQNHLTQGDMGALDLISEALKKVRFLQRQSILVWTDCHVVILWNHANTNSATVMASKFVASKSTADLLYPFGPGRQFRSGTASCRRDLKTVYADGPTGQLSFTIPLDEDRPVGWPREMTLDRDGFSVVY